MSERHRPVLSVIDGNGGADIAELLNDSGQLARDGKVQMAMVLMLDSEGIVSWRTAWLDDLPSPWSQGVAMIAHAQHGILSEGLEG